MFLLADKVLFITIYSKILSVPIDSRPRGRSIEGSGRTRAIFTEHFAKALPALRPLSSNRALTMQPA